MKITRECHWCGKEFQGRPNKDYCSSVCRGQAVRNRKKEKLADVTNQAVTTAIAHTGYTTNEIVSVLGDGIIKGSTHAINTAIPTLSDVVNTLADPSVKRSDKIWILGGAGLGSVVGYQFAEKGKKLSGILLGGVAGGALGYLLPNIPRWLSVPHLPPPCIDTIPEASVLNDNSNENQTLKVWTGSELTHLIIPTINPVMGGALHTLMGAELNNPFSVYLYGTPGGGKSTLATLFAVELSFLGSVLYAMSEEGITNSVKQRITKHDPNDNVKFAIVNKESEVLEAVKNYDFLILDSLNGLLPYQYHEIFYAKLKQTNLKGVVLINQVNKQGTPVGKNDLPHLVDVAIVVKEGIATAEKNRYKNGNEPNVFSIFKDNML